MRVVVRQPASQGYFHALHGIHEYKPEFAVKQVQLPRCVQRRAGLKRLPAGATDVLKWVKIGAKPGVAYILEKNGVKMPEWYKKATEKHAKAKHADKLRKNQPKEEAAAESAE